MKKWIINNADDRLAREFKEQCDLSLTALRLLTARGFCDFKKVAELFGRDEFQDPFIAADMQAAVDTINEYIDSYELICIYGDYDCDGITATALLYSYLESMGANVMYHINEREEGYGMSIEAIRRLADKGVKLIVTVDNGISCISEAEEAYALDMKLVITDHHAVPEELPRAEAVVNLHRPDCPSEYKELAGVGTALFLCAAMDGGSFEAVIEQYADLCAIGTVGDLVPLTGENRALVQKGLLYLPNTERFGLNSLMEHAGIDRNKMNAESLAYQICPRINAAGRLASPLLALKALLTEEPAEAEQLVTEMCELNQQRKETEAKIGEDIKRLIDERPELLNDRVLVLAGEGWHHGVIGIVSAKVMDSYGKPSLIISVENGEARGSARSMKGFNIHKCLTYCKELLTKYGGHECAGGFSLLPQNIEAFRLKVQEYAAQFDTMPAPTNDCDMKATAQDLELEAVRSLDKLQPFGVDNPQPLFMLSDCTVNAIYPLSGGKHTKLDVTCDNCRIQALVFSRSPESMFFRVGDRIDIAAVPSVNQYNGRESVNVKVCDMKPAGMNTDRYFAARDSYEKLRSGAELPEAYLRKMTPSRKELVYLYKLMTQLRETSVDRLFMLINDPAFNYCKLRLAIDIFTEAGLARFRASEQTVTMLPPSGKADLMSTATMKMLACPSAIGK